MAEGRRRTSDAERRRWNDQSLDMLGERVADLEDQISALRLLPERVSGLKGSVDDMREDFNAAAGLEERRVSRLHAKIEQAVAKFETQLADATKKFERELVKLGKTLGERFDTVDQAHADVARRGVDWKTVLAVASTVVVPIVVALIATRS